MYKCGICRASSKAGKPCLKHVLYKNLDLNGNHVDRPPGRQILKEVPVCESCYGRIMDGADYGWLCNYHRKKFQVTPLPTTITPRTVEDVNRDQGREMEAALGPIPEDRRRTPPAKPKKQKQPSVVVNRPVIAGIPVKVVAIKPPPKPKET